MITLPRYYEEGPLLRGIRSYLEGREATGVPAFVDFPHTFEPERMGELVRHITGEYKWSPQEELTKGGFLRALERHFDHTGKTVGFTSHALRLYYDIQGVSEKQRGDKAAEWKRVERLKDEWESKREEISQWVQAIAPLFKWRTTFVEVPVRERQPSGEVVALKKPIKAQYLHGLAVHKGLSGEPWAITHDRSGKRITDALTRKDAKLMVVRMVAGYGPGFWRQEEAGITKVEDMGYKMKALKIDLWTPEFPIAARKSYPDLPPPPAPLDPARYPLEARRGG